jgi:hypothetical protein
MVLTHTAHRRPRLCARRLDWLYKTMLDMMTHRYEIEEFQLISGLMPARASYAAQLPGAPTATRAEPAPYAPSQDVSRVIVTLDDELERQAKLLEECKTAGVADTEMAYMIRRSNTELEKRARGDVRAGRRRAATAARGSGRAARFTLNTEAVGGGSTKRVVRGDARLKKRKANAEPDAGRAPKLTKVPMTEKERKKRHKKKSVVRSYVAKGASLAPSAAATAAAHAAAS